MIDFAEIYMREISHCRVAGAFPPASLPGLQDLENSLRLGLLKAGSLSLAKDGTAISTRHLDSEDGVVDVDLVGRLLDGGVTVVFNGLQVLVPGLYALASEIRAQIPQRVQINGYLTPHDSRALPAHVDPYSVFVFQISGRKRWKVGPGGESSFTLSPGDILYMPKGTLHSVETADSASLHYTLALRDDLPEQAPLQPRVRSLASMLGLN